MSTQRLLDDGAAPPSRRSSGGGGKADIVADDGAAPPSRRSSGGGGKADIVAALEGFKQNSARARRAMQHRVFGFTIFCAMSAVGLWTYLPKDLPHFSAISLSCSLLLVPYSVCPMMVIDRSEFESGYLLRLLGVFYLAMASYWLVVDGLMASHKLGVAQLLWHTFCTYAEGAANVALAVLALVRVDSALQLRLFFGFQVFKLCVLGFFESMWVLHFCSSEPVNWHATAASACGAVIYTSLVSQSAPAPARSYPSFRVAGH
jgi:hypothetical protein